jgi:hypothetical protein
VQADFAQGLAGVSQAVSSLRAASADGFGISQAGGDALIKALDQLSGQLDEHLNDADRLVQEPPLGTTPAAQVYKPFLATIASDPVQGFIPALQKLQQDLQDTKDMIKKSMETYQATDHGNMQGITTAGGSIQSV